MTCLVGINVPLERERLPPSGGGFLSPRADYEGFHARSVGYSLEITVWPGVILHSSCRGGGSPLGERTTKEGGAAGREKNR